MCVFIKKKKKLLGVFCVGSRLLYSAPSSSFLVEECIFYLVLIYER